MGGYKRTWDSEWVNQQICTYGCGHCGFTTTCTLEEWLPLRDAHWKQAHPEIRQRKRRAHRIPRPVTRTVREYDGRLRHATESELKEMAL